MLPTDDAIFSILRNKNQTIFYSLNILHNLSIWSIDGQYYCAILYNNIDSLGATLGIMFVQPVAKSWGLARPHRSPLPDPVLSYRNPTRNSQQLHVAYRVLVEDLGVDGRIILKWIFRKWDVVDMEWIDQALDRDRWRALLNGVMILRFP